MPGPPQIKWYLYSICATVHDRDRGTTLGIALSPRVQSLPNLSLNFKINCTNNRTSLGPQLILAFHPCFATALENKPKSSQNTIVKAIFDL